MRWMTLALVLPFCACDAMQTRGARKVAPAEVAPGEEWKGVQCIAVLPPDNWTTDVTMEYITWYRAAVMTQLQRRGWTTAPIGRINRALNDWKFTLPGEVSMFSAEELSAKFGCDAILSWSIIKASGQDVELNFALHRRDGRVLWASGERDLELEFNLFDPTDLSLDHRMMSLAISESLHDFPVK